MKIKITNEVEKFITSLRKEEIAKVLRIIDLLEKFGSQLEMPHSKSLGKDLFELRIRGKKEIRIFYTFHKDLIYLLHAIIKKSHKIPKRELDTAHDRLGCLT